MSLPIQPLNEQEALVVRLRDEGNMSSRDIAVRLGVSRSRVAQVLANAKAKLEDVAEHGEDALSLLPARARRVVTDCGIPSRALVRSAIVSGRMTWSKPAGAICWDEVMLRRVSRQTWAALYEWAGRPPEVKEPRWGRPTGREVVSAVTVRQEPGAGHGGTGSGTKPWR